mmetsp:Transcript_21639/g.88251  ORF Transcript_21639/g.88251 Transcript_21639/m.88251 type:complete len:233 (-) Transcript_21639:1665-2363(-)
MGTSEWTGLVGSRTEICVSLTSLVDRFGLVFSPADFLVVTTTASAVPGFFVCFDLLDRRPGSLLRLFGWGVSPGSTALSSWVDFPYSVLAMTSMSTFLPDSITPASTLPVARLTWASTLSADRFTSICAVKVYDLSFTAAAAAGSSTSATPPFIDFASATGSRWSEDSPFSVCPPAAVSVTRASPFFIEFSPSRRSDRTDATPPGSRFSVDGADSPERCGSNALDSLARSLP